MKRLILVATIITVVALLFYACSEERDHANPFDPKYEISPLKSLSLENISIDSLKLSWPLVPDNDYKYEIRIDKKVGSSNWVEKYKILSSVDSMCFDSAEINQIITYRAFITFDENKSIEIEKSIDNKLPAPTSLTIAQNNIYTFTLNWQDNSKGEDGFKIERKIDDGAFTEIKTTTYTSFTDSTITKKGYGTVYYQIKAYRGIYFSDYTSNNTSVQFPSPSNLNLTQTTITSALLVWTDNSIGEDNFEIERKLSTESTYIKVGDVTGSDTSSKSWNDTELEPTKTYDYRVRAIKGINNTAYISKTLINIFQAPTGLTATQNNVSTFTLNWVDNSTGEDGFKIERKIDSGAYSVIATVTETSYVDNTVSKGYGTVYYQVRAYKGTTYFSSYASTNSAVSFPAPSNLTVIQTSITSANLSWADNSVGEDKFEIERKLSTETVYVKVADVTGSDTAIKSWNDTNLVLNLTYDYRVQAVKGLNSSSYALISGYLNDFKAPSNIEVTKINYTSATITWSDNYTGEDKFEIERKLLSETIYSKIAEVTGSDTATKNWIDSTIEPDFTYNYRVRIVSGTNYSAYANADFDNPFYGPTNLSSSVLNESSIKLTWIDNSDGEEGFKIDRKLFTDSLWVNDYASVSENILDWIDTEVMVGVGYNYKVRSFFKNYYTSYTNEISSSPFDISKFVLIPSGSFSMGSIDGENNELPVHSVTLTKSFLVSKYEITQKDWSEIIGNNPAIYYGVGDNYPVYNVNWYSLLVYCNLRSLAEGLTPCYTINGTTDTSLWGSVPTSTSNSSWDSAICDWEAKGYRLPTESEWEYMSRFNNNRTFPWGETTPSSNICNYNSNVGATTTVGSYPSGNSQLEICDLGGNVWEWVWDCYNTYPSDAVTDPSGLTTNKTNRVLRGGCWYNIEASIRCSYRYYHYPYRDRNDFVTNDDFGFRILRIIK